MLFLGMTLSVIGKVMLGLAIIWVHVTMSTERSIDEEVVKAFRRETYITITALILIGAGYFLEVYGLGGFDALMYCEGAECAAMVGGAT